jgi:hypothetical protein
MKVLQSLEKRLSAIERYIKEANSADEPRVIPFDISKLTDEELDTLDRIYIKMIGDWLRPDDELRSLIKELSIEDLLRLDEIHSKILGEQLVDFDTLEVSLVNPPQTVEDLLGRIEALPDDDQHFFACLLGPPGSPWERTPGYTTTKKSWGPINDRE